MSGLRNVGCDWTILIEWRLLRNVLRHMMQIFVIFFLPSALSGGRRHKKRAAGQVVMYRF